MSERKKMSDPILGKLIEEPVERDAVHVAIVPMIAGEPLERGERFRLQYGEKNVALSGIYNSDEECVGIVDPFLNVEYVEEGEQFWGMLFPQTVTGMRHHWQHPAFDETEVVEETDTPNPNPNPNEHEVWLREFADRWNFDFTELIEAGSGIGDQDWVTSRGRNLHHANELDDGDHELFWEHLEGFMEAEFNQEHRNKMVWSCTC